MIVYALGFSLGLIVGIMLEQRLAIGYISYHVNSKKLNLELVEILRDFGYGVTHFNGVGKTGQRVRMEILTKRKNQTHLLKTIQVFEPDAFIISYEPKMFKGGYLTNLMRKKMMNKRPVSSYLSEDESVAKRFQVKKMKLMH